MFFNVVCVTVELKPRVQSIEVLVGLEANPQPPSDFLAISSSKMLNFNVEFLKIEIIYAGA